MKLSRNIYAHEQYHYLQLQLHGDLLTARISLLSRFQMTIALDISSRRHPASAFS